MKAFAKPQSFPVFSMDSMSRLQVGQQHVFSDVEDIDELVEDNHRIINEQDEEFETLKDSILLLGVRDHIKAFLDRTTGKVNISDGHRRARAVAALRRFGVMARLPMILTMTSEHETEAEMLQRASTAAVTNLSGLKKDLKGVEKAKAIAKFMQNSKLTSVSMAAKALGVDRKTVERSLNILLLPESVQNILLTHADVIKERDALELGKEYKAMLKIMDSASAEQDIMSRIDKLLDTEKPSRQAVLKKTVHKVDIEVLTVKLREEKIPQGTIDKVLSFILAGA